MNKIIRYGIDPDGQIISQVGQEVAYPVLDFEAIGQGGDGFAPGDFHGPTRYELQKFPLKDIYYPHIKWTKKIPTVAKNEHRVFWGFKPLPIT